MFDILLSLVILNYLQNYQNKHSPNIMPHYLVQKWHNSNTEVGFNHVAAFPCVLGK